MRKGVKPFFCLLLLWVTLSCALGQASVDELNVRFRTLEFQGGVTLGVQDVIFQDSLGFIWFGGENGLVRFDGYNLKVFRHISGKPGVISNNNVHGIAEDKDGNLWVATERGLNRFNRKTEDFSVFLHDPENPTSLSYDVTRDVIVTREGKVVVATFGGGLSVLDTTNGYFQSYTHDKHDPKSIPGNVIWTVMEDLDGYLWVGTNGTGAFRFNIKTEEVLRYSSQRASAFHISHDTVRAITQDSKGHMWLGTDGGVHRLDAFGAVKQHWQYEASSPSSLGGNFVWDITEDASGMIWVATDGGGLSLIDPRRAQVRRFQHTPLDPTTISSNVVRGVLEDRAGDIWAVHYPAGVSVFYRSAEHVKQYRHVASNESTLSNSSVLSFLEDKSGALWIGTDGGGLNRLQADAQNFEHWQFQNNDRHSLSANAVLSLAQTEDGVIWVGTWGGGLNQFNVESERFKRYPVDAQNIHSLQNANVWTMLVDSNNQLWLGTEGGGMARYNAANDAFVNYPHGRDDPEAVIGSVVWVLHEDLQGNIWAGTDAGLSRLDKSTQRFHHFQFQAGNNHSLSDNGVLSLFDDHEGRLWVGTRAGLNRFDEETQKFKRVTVEDGLASDSISSILQDREGLLWLGTGSGLSRYDPETGEVYNYHQSSWAWGKFNYGAALRRETGELLFGGVNGFVSFLPRQLQRNTYVPPLHFTDFQVFNKSQEVGAKNSLLSQSLAYTDHITLDYWQSVFSFEFTALNYHGTVANQYAFMLEGFDHDWNYVGPQREATYTNLSAGHYVFKVKASNNEGLWSETPLEMPITILPKPWQTWWAYTLYVSLLAFGVWFYVRSQRREIARERAVIERLRQLDKVKDNFLANTSHELRTPLNGIIGLTDSLVEGAAGPVGDNMKYNLEMISSSGKRLASLVNDILDFSRLKNQTITINKEPIYLRTAVESVVTICRPLIGAKELDLSNTVEESLPAVLADENRLQQMLYNLIGNAIKFTDSGNIEVYAEQQGKHIWVHVKDSGVGIAEHKIDKIFDSFEQGEDHENRNYTGAGLGLSITKQLVELHGGELRVDSKPGEGSNFYFSLERAENASPVIESSNAAFNQCLLDLDEDHEGLASNYSERISGIDRMLVKENQKFKILIVDDEPVNRQVLINQLSLQGYQLREATNGREALDYLRDEGGFNLVLLDIMMPGMSGYEVCTRIRRQYSMNELPIIFLTAKNLISDLVDGFDMGANDFLTKPLAKGELVSRVRTHMQLLDVHTHLEERVKERTHEVERANQVLETLDGIVATINQEVILERLLDVLLREATRLFPATERSVYWSYSERFDRFTPLASNGFHATELQQIYIPRDALCRRYCVDSERITNDIYLVRPTPHTAGNQPLMSLPRPKSILAMAIHFDDCIIGFIALLNYQDSEAFNSLERQTLLRFFAHAKSALLKARLMQSLKLQNQKLEDAGLIDPLTGLRNRRYLHKYLDSDIALTLRSHRNRPPGTAIPPNSDLVFFMMDVDRFKATNDTYGHAAGDRFLIEVKQAMETVFRKSDFLLRWGGDEFLVVARFSNRNAAPVLAERMRTALEQCEFDMGEDVITRQSGTIGFACFPFLVSDPLAFSWSQVLDIADMAMRVGKKNGRNCWVGLDANIEKENDLLFQNILAVPESLVNQNKLVLRSNLPPNMPIQW